MSRMVSVAKPWTRQPPPGTKIDFNNPLAKGLVQLVVNGHEVVRNEMPVFKLKTDVNVAGRGGLGTRCYDVSDASSGLQYSPTPDIGAGVMTQFCKVGIYNGQEGLQYSYAMGNFNGSTGSGIALHHNGSANCWAMFDGNGLTSSGEILELYSSPFLVGVRDGSNIAIYRDGLLKAAAGVASYYSVSDAAFCVNSLQLNTIQWACSSPIQLAGRYNRVLSEAEIQELSSNPWQIFVPQSTTYFFTTNTSHATSGSLVSGNATLSGTANHMAVHATSGSLVSGSASLSATAEHTITVGVTAAEIWNYEIAPGLTAAQALFDIWEKSHTTNDVAAAVLLAAQATPIAADVKRINNATVLGSGTTPDKWRGS